MNYTSLEQSKKLVKLGLNPDTADMIYYDYEFTGALSVFNKKPECTKYKNCADTGIPVTPCWSVGALIELMPSVIGDSIGCKYFLNVSRDYVEYINSAVSALYATYHNEMGDNILEACYNMIVWLLENNYIEKVHKNEE